MFVCFLDRYGFDVYILAEEVVAIEGMDSKEDHKPTKWPNDTYTHIVLRNGFSANVRESVSDVFDMIRYQAKVVGENA